MYLWRKNAILDDSIRGWFGIGIGWMVSGGVRYRAPHSANNRNHNHELGILILEVHNSSVYSPASQVFL